MIRKKEALLILEDGTVYRGRSFGWGGEKTAEIIFNTALTGYEEILTDPSYCGQMVTMCYPHIGNYGINLEDSQSYKIWAEGIIVKEYSNTYSNYRAKISLGEYLKKNKVLGIEGIDTRALVRRIREKGAMKAIASVKETDINSLKRKLKKTPSISDLDLVSKVNHSPHSVFREYKAKSYKGKPVVAVIDFGATLGIVKILEELSLNVRVFPGNTEFNEILKLRPDGVLFSNGPGDPATVPYGIKLAKDLIDYNNENYLPVMGICLGHQLLGLGAGAKTYKLKFGNHGNHPVKDLRTGKIEITAQNHNFCVDPESLPEGFMVTHINLNDNTVEGIRHKTLPVISYQYHPEACPGPHDSKYIFEEFRKLING